MNDEAAEIAAIIKATQTPSRRVAASLGWLGFLLAALIAWWQTILYLGMLFFHSKLPTPKIHLVETLGGALWIGALLVALVGLGVAIFVSFRPIRARLLIGFFALLPIAPIGP